MTITVVFDPPLPSDSPSTFNTKAFSTLGDLNDWSTEANALAGTVNSDASTASTGASTATTQAGIATTQAGNAATSAGTATTQAGIATAAAASVNAIEATTHAATSKTTPVDADEFPMSDSAASWGLKKLTWANLKATAKTYFDTLYLGISATAANASQLLGGTWAQPGAIGSTTPAAGAFTTLSATGNVTLGDASTDTLNVGNGGIVKDASGNTSFGGSVLLTSAAGLGYGTGAGGTVTQATSKGTAVTLNKPCGQITMHNAALAAGASATFQVNNSLIADTDTVCVNMRSSFSSYRVEAGAISTGSFYVRVTNITAGSLSEAPAINFAVIKGATS